MTLIAGRAVSLLVLIAFLFSLWYASRRFQATGRFNIRDLHALRTIEEAVGRATEMGRPLHWSFGAFMQVDAQVFAGFSILAYTAKLCARYDSRLLVSLYWPEIVPMCQEIVKRAFIEEGKPDAYREEDIRFYGASHNQAMIGTIAREKVAGNFIIGNLGHEAVLSLEAGALVGAIQVGGTVNTHQLPFLAAGTDAMFIGAEMFAANAHISRTPVTVGSVLAEEGIKIAALALIPIGALLATCGNSALQKLLTK